MATLLQYPLFMDDFYSEEEGNSDLLVRVAPTWRSKQATDLLKKYDRMFRASSSFKQTTLST
jgi:hypothetical protein